MSLIHQENHMLILLVNHAQDARDVTSSEQPMCKDSNAEHQVNRI